MKRLFAAAVLLLVLPFAVSANNKDYTFVEAGAVRHYPDLLFWDKAEPYDGAYVRGSFAFNEWIYAYGDISRTSGEKVHFVGESFYVPYDYKYMFGQVGAGAHYPLNSQTDALVELAYVHLNERIGPGEEGRRIYGFRHVSRNSWKGARFNLGLREALTDHVEGWLKVGYISLRDNHNDYGKYTGDGKYTGEVGVQVKITPRWGVVAEAQYLHAITTYQLGGRASF